MTTTVFLLNEPAKESAMEQADLIEATLADYYPLRALPKDRLLAALEDVQQAVVLFSAPVDKINLQVARFRAVLPHVAPVAIVSQNDTEKIQGAQFECDFLIAPLTRFEVLARVSTAVRMAELMATMEASTQHDEVTQLYNRRYFLKRLNEEISLSKRHLSPLSVVVLGINYYQVYLDSYGYDFIIGLLRHLALEVNSYIRHEDIIARISDDEIGLLLPRSTEKGAKTLARRIVEAVNATTFDFGEGKDRISEELSVLAGIAGYPAPDDAQADADADAIVRFARHALHNARCSGGKPVELFSEIKPAL